LAQRQNDFKELGIQLVAVSYDSVKTLKSFSEKGKGKKKVKYPLLSDPKSKMIKAFGILNEKHKEGHKWHGVPYPHIFLVNPDGRIDGKFSEKRYQDRPKVDDILAFIKKMQNKPVQVTQDGALDG
jgi:peroxiredoxin